MGIRGGVVCQNAYSSNLGRLLGLDGARAEEPTEEKGDAEGEQAYHLGSRPSNFFPRCSRIGPTSLRSRPRSPTTIRRTRITPPGQCSAARYHGVLLEAPGHSCL